MYHKHLQKVSKKWKSSFESFINIQYTWKIFYPIHDDIFVLSSSPVGLISLITEALRALKNWRDFYYRWNWDHLESLIEDAWWKKKRDWSPQKQSRDTLALKAGSNLNQVVMTAGYTPQTRAAKRGHFFVSVENQFTSRGPVVHASTFACHSSALLSA